MFIIGWEQSQRADGPKSNNSPQKIGKRDKIT